MDTRHLWGLAILVALTTAWLAAPASAVGGRDPSVAVAPAQPTQNPVTVTGLLLDGDGQCGAAWRVQRCGDGAMVAVRSDMDIRTLRGSLVRVQGLPVACAPTGRDVVWLSSIEPVADCSPPTATPTPSPTPPAGPNLALGRPVTASWDDAAAPARQAVDGNAATAWRAAGDAAWIYVDLGEDRTFNRLRLTWGTPHAVRYGLFVREYDEWEFKYEVDGSDGGLDEFVIPRLYGRFVLLYAVQSSDAAGAFVLHEWEIYGQDTANLSLGKTVTVSDAQDCCAGPLAVDGRYDTGWVSLLRSPWPTPAPEGRNPWILVRLPDSSPVVELRMFWDHVAFPWLYRVVFYQGGSWRTLQVRSLRGGLHLLSYALPIRADAILLYTDTLPSVGAVALAEVEVYSAADPAAAGRPGLAPSAASGVTWQWSANPVAPARALGGSLPGRTAPTDGSAGSGGSGGPTAPRWLPAAPPVPVPTD